MADVRDNKVLLDIYLESRDEEDLFILMENLSVTTINRAVVTTMKNNNISDDRFHEFKNLAYLSVYNKVINMDEYNGSCQNFNSLIWKWVIASIRMDLKIEQQIKENEISLDEFNEEYLSLEREGLVCDFEGEMKEVFRSLDKQKILLKSFEILNPTQRKFIYLYFGFGDGRAKSMEEVGELTGFTRMYVSDSIKKSLEKIREYIYSNDTRSSIFDEEYKNTKMRKWTYKK